MFTQLLFDAMAQLEFHIPESSFKTILSESGIEYVSLFPRTQFGKTSEKHAIEIKEQLGDKIILGSMKRFDQRNDLNDWFVDDTIRQIKEYDFKFIGELMFTHADKEDGEVNPTLERYVNSNSPEVFRLLDQIAKEPIPVMFHWEVYHWDRDWPNISAMLERYPMIKFIWPHCGFATSEQVETVLSKYSNVYPTLSKREMIRWKNLWISHTGDDVGGFQIVNEEWHDKVDGAIVDENGIIKQDWIDLFKKYPDRFMFATDAHKFMRWKTYDKIVKIWRDILGQLDVELAEKIGNTNAKRVYNVS